MVLVEDEDVIVYSLPKQKSRPKNMYHSLKEARQNARILINKYQLKKNNLASFFSNDTCHLLQHNCYVFF